MLFPESTAESLNKKNWNEKLLKVCLFAVNGNISHSHYNVSVFCI